MSTKPTNDPSKDEYDEMAEADVAALVVRCREAEGMVRDMLPLVRTYARMERILSGGVAPEVVAVGAEAKRLVAVMDEYADAKRAAVGM